MLGEEVFWDGIFFRDGFWGGGEKGFLEEE